MSPPIIQLAWRRSRRIGIILTQGVDLYPNHALSTTDLLQSNIQRNQPRTARLIVFVIMGFRDVKGKTLVVRGVEIFETVGDEMRKRIITVGILLVGKDAGTYPRERLPSF